MAGSSLLKAGLIWKIGDGQNVKIWKDQRITSPLSNKIQTLVRLLSEDAFVSELIDMQNHCQLLFF